MEKVHTLITGASFGIGRSLAFSCAKRKMNLVLIALPGKELEELASQIIEEYGVDVLYLGIDLTEENAAQSIFDFCQHHQVKINILINNAGMGSLGSFERHGVGFHEKMIKLNVIAVVSLTRVFLPELRKRDKANILNMGSSASFFDVPYKMVYSSTKSFVYSFSRILREELRGTNIKVTVVCPGGVNTSEEVRKRTEESGWLAKKLISEPEEIAEACMKGLLKNRIVVLPGIVAKIYFYLSMIVPYNLQLRIFSRMFKKSA